MEVFYRITCFSVLMREMGVLWILLFLAHLCQGRVVSDSAAQPRNLGREPEYKRVCYYTNWSQYRKQPARFFPFNIDPFLCTHLIFAFAKLNYNGHLAPYEWNDIQYPHLYKQFTGLKRKNPHLKTLLAVGGWTHGSRPFTEMVKTKVGRQSFIDHAIQYLRTHNFDGLDLDWEYPANRGSPKEDRKRFSILIQEMKAAFIDEASRTGKSRLLLAAAVGVGMKIAESAYEVAVINKHLDFINLMSYDLHGSWGKTLGINAPLYPDPNNPDPKGRYSVDDVLKFWLRLGATRDKLVLGIATYGRSFTLCSESQVNVGDKHCGAGKPAPFTREKGFISYYEIKDRLKKGWTRVWSESQMVPYAYSFKDKQWVGYDDIQSVQLKAQYIKQNKLAGAMVWSIDLDDFANIGTKGKVYPLTRAIRAVLEDAEYPSFEPPPKISAHKRLPPPKPEIQNDDRKSKTNGAQTKSRSPYSPPKSPYSPPKSFKKKPVSKTYLPRPGALNDKPETKVTPPSRSASSQAGGPVLGTIATPKYNNKSQYTTKTVPRSTTPATTTKQVTGRTLSTRPNKVSFEPKSTKESPISKSASRKAKENVDIKATETAATKKMSRTQLSSEKQLPRSPYKPLKSPPTTTQDVRTEAQTTVVIAPTTTNRYVKENSQKTTTAENVIPVSNESVKEKSDKSVIFNNLKEIKYKSKANNFTLKNNDKKPPKKSDTPQITLKKPPVYPKSPYKPLNKVTKDVHDVIVATKTTSLPIQTTTQAKYIKTTQMTKIIISNNKTLNESWKRSSYDAKTNDKELSSLDLKQGLHPEQDKPTVKPLKSPYTKLPYIWNPDMTVSVLRVIQPTAHPSKASRIEPSQPALNIATSPYKPWTTRAPISTINMDLVITDSVKHVHKVVTESLKHSGGKVITESPSKMRVQNVITDLPKPERSTMSLKLATSPFKPWKTTIDRKYIRPTQTTTVSARELVESVENVVKEKRNPIVDAYDGHVSNKTGRSDGEIPELSIQRQLSQLTAIPTRVVKHRTTKQAVSMTTPPASRQGASPTDSGVKSTRTFFLFARNKTYPTQRAAYQSRATKRNSSRIPSTSPSTARMTATTQMKRTTNPPTKRVPTTTTIKDRTTSTKRVTTNRREISRVTTVRNRSSTRKTTARLTTPSTKHPIRVSKPTRQSPKSTKEPSTVQTMISSTRQKKRQPSATTQVYPKPRSNLSNHTIKQQTTQSTKRKTTPTTTQMYPKPRSNSSHHTTKQQTTQSTKRKTTPTTTQMYPKPRSHSSYHTIKQHTTQSTKRKTTSTTTQMYPKPRSNSSYHTTKQQTTQSTKRKTTHTTTQRQKSITTKSSKQRTSPQTSGTRINIESQDVERNTGTPAHDYRKIATTSPGSSQLTKTYWIRTRPTGPQKIFAWMTDKQTTTKINSNRSLSKMAKVITTAKNTIVGSTHSTDSERSTTNGVTEKAKRTHWPMQAILGDDHIHPLKSALFGLDISKKPTENKINYQTASPIEPTTGGWLLDWLHMITSKPTYKPLMKTKIPDVLGPIRWRFKAHAKPTPRNTRIGHTTPSKTRKSEQTKARRINQMEHVTPAYKTKPLQLPVFKGRKQTPEPVYWKKSIYTPAYHKIPSQTTYMPSYTHTKLRDTAKPMYDTRGQQRHQFHSGDMISDRIVASHEIRDSDEIRDAERIVESDRIRDLDRIGEPINNLDRNLESRIKDEDKVAAVYHPDDIPADKKLTRTEPPNPDCITESDNAQYDNTDYNTQIDYPQYEDEYSDYYDNSKSYDYQRRRQVVNNDYSNPVVRKPVYGSDFKNDYQQKVKLRNDYYDQGDDYQSQDYVIAQEPSGSREIIGQNGYQDSQPSRHVDVNRYAVPEFTCPSVFGIYPDPIDCRQFYQCVWFVPFHHMCGIGTVWNQHMKICDWPGSNSCFT